MRFRHRSEHLIRRGPGVAFVALLLCLLLAPGAVAQDSSCDAPSELPGFDQYCESLPSPGGRQGPGDAAPSGPAVSPGVQKQLSSGDRETVRKISEPKKKKAKSTGEGVERTSAPAGTATVRAPGDGDDSVSGLFIAGIIALVLALIGAAVWQRRRSTA